MADFIRAAKLLEFAPARLVEVYGEPANIDFVLGMREVAQTLREDAAAPSQKPMSLGELLLASGVAPGTLIDLRKSR